MRREENTQTMRQRGREIFSIGIVALIVALAVLLILAGCLCELDIHLEGYLVRERSVEQHLKMLSFKDVKVLSRSVFWPRYKGGSSGDVVIFTAEGTNSTGERFNKITVSSGWPWKGCTIRGTE